MENKLQELTDKLYKEGLSKGKEEGDAILAEASKKAEEIIGEAKRKAEEILKKAGKEAEDFKTKTEGDVKMAAVQSIQATKSDIENLLVGSLSDTKVDETLKDSSFVKDMLKEIVKKFSTDGAVDLNVVLPESMKSEIEPFIKNELSKQLKSGLNASFSKKIAGGFNIGPKDGSYFVSMTDETFKSLISEYLRPATRKILFGE